MGTDIHVYFDVQTDDGWEPLFPITPHPYWYHAILEKMIEEGSAQMAMGEADEERAAEKLEEHFKSLSNEEEIFKKFSDHPEFAVNLNLPGVVEHFDDGSTYYDSPIRDRDYAFFGYINGVRGNECQFERLKGIPADASIHIIRKYGDDDYYHSQSWVMVSDILENEKTKNTRQSKWLKEHVPEPQKTRMIFAFDS